MIRCLKCDWLGDYSDLVAEFSDMPPHCPNNCWGDEFDEVTFECKCGYIGSRNICPVCKRNDLKEIDLDEIAMEYDRMIERISKQNNKIRGGNRMSDNALVVAEKLDVSVLFSDGGMDRVLEEIEKQAMAHVPDISTDQGRKDIASLAYQVARSKTLIVKAIDDAISEYKKKVDEGNGKKRKAKDFLDGLKEKVRQPLTDWEAEDALKKAEEDRKEKEKIDARLLALSKVGLVLPFMEVATMPDNEYETKLTEATIAFEAEQKRKADEEAARKEEEERLRKERAEQEAKAKELAEKEALIAAEQRRIEAERRAIEDEKRKEQERKDREAFEAKAKEEARIAAEKAAKERAEREAKEAKERAEKEAAEKARQEALRPDKEKLLRWCDWMDSDNVPKPSIENEDAKTILYDALHALRSLVNDIRMRAERL